MDEKIMSRFKNWIEGMDCQVERMKISDSEYYRMIEGTEVPEEFANNMIFADVVTDAGEFLVMRLVEAIGEDLRPDTAFIVDIAKPNSKENVLEFNQMYELPKNF